LGGRRHGNILRLLAVMMHGGTGRVTRDEKPDR